MLHYLDETDITSFKGSAGAVLQPPTNCWLVVEYLPGGTLKQWLYGTTNRNAPKRSMVEKATMALEIAKGMLVRSEPVRHSITEDFC